ncbi:MAG: hypothetical protein AB7I38_18970 [Dehalococcoidia bacterium]
MLAVTGWAAATWAKLTTLLAAAVGVCWLALGTGSPWFWLALLAAVLLEVHLTGQLVKEWAYEARSCWWWAP